MSGSTVNPDLQTSENFTPEPPDPTRVDRTIFLAVAARVAVLPLSAVGTAVTTHVMIRALGPADYAIVSLIVTIPLLLPVADLGAGGVVTNAAGSRDPHIIAATVRACFRMLIPVVIALSAGSLLLYLFGAWGTVLGTGTDRSWVDGGAAAFFCIFAVTVPLGLGQRLLVGSGATHVALLSAGVQPLILIVLAPLLIRGSSDAFHAVMLFGVSALLTSALQFFLGMRATRISTRMLRASAQPLPQVWKAASAMLIAVICVPITFQSGRLVLGHRAPVADLAEYALVFNVFTAVLSISSAAGLSLWGTFASDRDGEIGPTWRRALRISSLLGLALTAGWVICAPTVVTWLGGGQVSTNRPLIYWLAVVLLVQTLHMPSGGVLTDSDGLLTQAKLSVGVALATTSISWMVAPSMGAAAPAMSVALCYSVLYALPCYLVVRRRVARPAAIGLYGLLSCRQKNRFAGEERDARIAP